MQVFINARKFLLFKTSGRNGRCSRSIILVFVLSVTVIALVVVIAVTYGNDLQCDDKYHKNHAHTRSKNSSKIHNSTTGNKNSSTIHNSTASNNSISFFLFSDVHLDPYYKATAGNDFCRNESKPSTYNASYGRIGCDSPLRLLLEGLNAMKEHAHNLPNLDFVMLSGKGFSQYENRRNICHSVDNWGGRYSYIRVLPN
jgi:hypothetical protein